MIEWRELAASYASTSDMKHKTLDAKYITFDELLREVMPLLSASAMNTTLEIPVFTDWVDEALKGSILQSRKKNSWKWYRASSRNKC
jgi:hypothetical protein